MKAIGEGIACPACGNTVTEVRDSRACHGGIRRRRACPKCTEWNRFSTIEIPLEDEALLHKKRLPIIEALGLLGKVSGLPEAKRTLVLSLIEVFAGEPSNEGENLNVQAGSGS